MTAELRHSLEQCGPQELFDLLPPKQQDELRDDFRDTLDDDDIYQMMTANIECEYCDAIYKKWVGFLKQKDLLDNWLYASLIEDQWEQENQ